MSRGTVGARQMFVGVWRGRGKGGTRTITSLCLRLDTIIGFGT